MGQFKQLDTSVQPARVDQWSMGGIYAKKPEEKAGKPVFKWNWETIWNNLTEKWPKNRHSGYSEYLNFPRDLIPR